MSKMVLAYHHIQVPAFAVFYMNRKVKRSKRLKFPLLVKSISEEGSVGIADRKSTRLNSSHSQISYAVFCLKKKKTQYDNRHVRLNPPRGISLPSSLTLRLAGDLVPHHSAHERHDVRVTLRSL